MFSVKVNEMPVLHNPFEKFGVKRVINAATSATSLGGNILDPRVSAEMAEVSRCFVYIPELQAWAGNIMADLTGAEAGLPVAGAVAGIMLGAAACIMRDTELNKYDPLKDDGGWSHITTRLPMRTEGLPTEFIVQKTNRNSYDYSIELAGGKLVEVEPDVESLRSAYKPGKTAGYYFTARNLRKSQPLKEVIKVAHSLESPVLVDAASEVPPRRKLRLYIENGADLVVYSGGKHIGGPNNSGLLVGRSKLVKLAHLQSYPFNGVGRAAKMSRETIVGLIAALKLYLGHDEEAAFDGWMKTAEWMRDQLKGIPGVEVGITYQRAVEDGEPMAPFTYLRLNKEITGIDGVELVEVLKEGDPPIYAIFEPWFMMEDCENMVTLNPEYMLDGEAEIVIEKVTEILSKFKK